MEQSDPDGQYQSRLTVVRRAHEVIVPRCCFLRCMRALLELQAVIRKHSMPYKLILIWWPEPEVVTDHAIKAW